MRVQYEFERRKYAQDLIDFDKKFSALFSGKPRTADNQNGVSHEQFLEYASSSVAQIPHAQRFSRAFFTHT